MTVHELKILVESFHSLIAIETVDEERATGLVEDAAAALGATLFTWSVARGLSRRPSKHAILASTTSPFAALRHIEELSCEGVFLFHDLHHHLDDPVVARQLREVVRQFAGSRSCIVVTGTDLRVPAELENDAVRCDLQPPDRAELDQVVESALRSLQREYEVRIELTPRERQALLDALNGLTLNQARQCIASALLEDGVLNAADISKVSHQKVKMIRDNGLLEYFPALDNNFELGGFDKLKEWLDFAAIGFTAEARALDLAAPRGVLFVGVQGCGKSLAAKAISRQWNTPLLKLDAGSLYNKYLGETERNFRKAIKLAESLAPVVLWIDEIEKAFATGSGQATDSGTSLRMLGYFLTWLQEKKDNVFVVGTANRLDILPPEILRKGRFDEVFFVDLPEDAERKAIFDIHLRSKKHDPAAFDLDQLASASGGFSGAEIEQAVVAAIYRSLFKQCTLDTDLVLQEVLETVPLSVSRSEDISALRQYAAGRFVNVSGKAPEPAPTRARRAKAAAAG